jgi:Flp pilus assembly protein TadG
MVDVAIHGDSDRLRPHQLTMRAIKLRRDLIRNPDGAAAVEFSLVITVFLLATFGIIELGRYTMLRQALTETVHDGTRYAVVHGSKSSSPATASSLTSLVQDGSSVLTPSSINVTVTFWPNNAPGSTVTIVATYPWSSVVPLLKLSSATITATSVATILN